MCIDKVDSMIRTRLMSVLSTLLVIILIPYMITMTLSGTQDIQVDEGIRGEKENEIVIYINGGEQVLGLEEYIVGVLAAEMPANFEIEALKAQAVAARTYTLRHLGNATSINQEELGQSYLSIEEMEARWGVNGFVENYNRISSAVQATEGEVIVYEDEPIEAVFHSTSAGMTRAAEDIWETELPYLLAVDSSEDIKAPTFTHITQLSEEEIIHKIKSQVPDFEVLTYTLMESVQIISRSEAGYINAIQIGNKIFSGEELRNYLNLNSSNFSIEEYEDSIRFVSKGYGHGVGLSQYGAHFMAEEGRTYEEILKHYYSGVEITQLQD